MDIDLLAEQIYEQNKAVGWWDDPDRCIYQTMQLVSTEIAEATEGERKNLNDDHLPWRSMGEVELADAMIRILDIGGRYSWHYDKRIEPHPMMNVDSIAGKHLAINIALADLAMVVYLGGRREDINIHYSAVINSILFAGEKQGYVILEALYEKLEYNKKRADHKRENRAKEGGKKF